MTESPAWTEPYKGLLFGDGGRGPDDYDCYGLGRYVMRREAGIALPVYAVYESTDDLGAIAPQIEAALAAHDSPWREVAWEARRPLDWVLYRRGLVPGHVSIVADRDWALHTFREAGCSGVERFDRFAHRREYAMLGIYRHRDVVLKVNGG